VFSVNFIALVDAVVRSQFHVCALLPLLMLFAAVAAVRPERLAVAVGAAHVPSARRKLVVPPPDRGTTPATVEVKMFGVIVIVPEPVTGLEPIVREPA